MNSLQNLLSRCYQVNRENIPVPQNILAGLKDNELRLSDFDIQHNDIGPLCKFLINRNALNTVEKLVIKNTFAPSKRLRRLASVRAGGHSGLHLQGGKLLKTVFKFLSSSQAVRSLEVDGVVLNVPMLQALGRAMSERQELFNLDFQEVTFRNMNLGCSGLRALTPHFVKCLIQCLSLENCNLDDETLPYISSIIKAHEAFQNNFYWNSTLRAYPERNSIYEEGERQRRMQYVYYDGVTNTGLLLLNISRNKYTSKGSGGIYKLLQANQWVLGVNFSHNNIGEDGIAELQQLLTVPADSSALLCLHLGGNPGCSLESLRTLSDLAEHNVDNPVLNSLPNHCASYLVKWLHLQHECSLLKKPRPAKKSSRRIEGHTVLKKQEVDNAFIRAEATGAQEVISIATESTRSLRLGEKEENLLNSQSLGHTEEHNIICDEELPSGQNYLQDMMVEGFIPPSPGAGIDGRPPSRNSIRPRYESYEQHQQTYVDVTSGNSRNFGYLQSTSSRPTSSRSARLQKNEKCNVTRSASTDRVLELSGRGAQRYTNPYDSADITLSRAKSRPRKTAMSSLEIASMPHRKRSDHESKPPFRPSSAKAPINGYRSSNTRSRASLNPVHNFQRVSLEARNRNSGRDRSMSAPVGRGRRRQSSIDLARTRQQRKQKKYKVQGYSRGIDEEQMKKQADILVDKIGKTVSDEFSKVVNMMSSRLQDVSAQMQSFTETLSESLTMINMSRDNTFVTYNDVAGDSHHVNNVDLDGPVDKDHPNGRLHPSELEDNNLSRLIEEGLRSKLQLMIQSEMAAMT